MKKKRRRVYFERYWGMFSACVLMHEKGREWDELRGLVFPFNILQWNYDHKLGPKPWLWCDRHFRWRVRLCSQSSLLLHGNRTLSLEPKLYSVGSSEMVGKFNNRTLNMINCKWIFCILTSCESDLMSFFSKWWQMLQFAKYRKPIRTISLFSSFGGDYRCPLSWTSAQLFCRTFDTIILTESLSASY